MATSKASIFKKFLMKVTDRDLCRLLTESEMIELLTMRMSESLSLYFKNIKQDLTIQTYAEFFREDFSGDGILTQFTISQWSNGVLPASTTPYVSVNGVELIESIDFTFDSNTLEFTLFEAPTTPLQCGYNFSGEFDATFSDQEEWITATGMVLAWTSDKYYSLDIMVNRQTGKDLTSYSPANLLDKLRELRDRSTGEMRDRKNSYSYDGFSGYNS